MQKNDTIKPIDEKKPAKSCLVYSALRKRGALVSDQPFRAKRAQGLHPLQIPQSMRGVPQQREHHKAHQPGVTAPDETGESNL
ncbi:MAG: hypothetical protein HY394_03150 [Candidatus Diapherotrites archaeon]|nr:hypothetical protein [Candidatus Diapherotrites archaeon]